MDLFGGITGDLSLNHVDAESLRHISCGLCIVRGASLVDYMSNGSTAILVNKNSPGETPVSLGYDRIRFIAPVFIGDTITVTYRVESVDPEKRESRADEKGRNQNGTLCAIATHILRWVPNT